MDFKKIILALSVIVPVLSSCDKDKGSDLTDKDVCEVITDKTFKAQVYSQFDSNNDGIITRTEAEAVTSISVSDTKITSLSGIEVFTKLETLSINGVSISTLDLSKNTALVTVSIVDCSYLASVTFGSVATIESLVITGTKISSLDVTKMTALKSLDCSKNSLTALDVTKNTALQTLKCSLNSIKTLDISKNAALKSLDCYMPSLIEIIINKVHVNTDFFDTLVNGMEGVKITMA